ncbi:histidine kinase [Streptomyces sp. NPDC005820]|uniref:histidine kinase n=1 Tax=Streptomyces sp. NPDC005820 TaxID=3157069 RepID=UPI0033D3B6B6
MSDRAPVRTLARAVRGSRPTPALLAHLTFFVVLGAGLVRLVELRIGLCWEIVTVSGLLALVYAGGLAAGERLGRFGRPLWVVALLALWSNLVLLSPPSLTGAYVWGAVPLACAALRVLGRRAAGVAVAALTAVLAAQLVRSAGRFDAEIVLIPVAAVWGTVALYRSQQRDAAERLRLVEELRGARDVLARQQRRAGVLAERARIARDLHDTLAQELSGGVMLLQAAERDWDARADVARTRVRAVADGLHTTLAETRRIIRDLTPSAVDEAGLEGALRLLCARAEAEGAAARVRFRTTATTHAPPLAGPASAPPAGRTPARDDRPAPLDRRFADLDEQVPVLDRRFADVDEQVPLLDRRPAGLDEQVPLLDRRPADLDWQVPLLDRRPADLDWQAARPDRQGAPVGRRFTAADEQTAPLHRQFAALDGQTAPLDKQFAGLDGQAAATLFRVAQSTLANVREHAHAVNVQVTLRAGADRVELEVRDDGAGFEPARITGPSPAGRGLGLPAARARLRECGGDLAIGSTPGHGTCVRATVPTAPSARPAPVAAR